MKIGPRQRFENHLDPALIEEMRRQVEIAANALDLSVYRIRDAELQVEEATRAVIVRVLNQEFPNRWFPLRVSRGWPAADCIIDSRQGAGLIRFGYSPETSAAQGGEQIEAVAFRPRLGEPSMRERIFGQRRQAEPELELTDPIPRPAPKRAAPSPTTPAKARLKT